MKLRDKLWIMWGVLAICSGLAAVSGEREAMYSFAIASAVAGWLAFLLPRAD